MAGSRLFVTAAGRALSAARAAYRLPSVVRQRAIAVTANIYIKLRPETENNFAHSILRSREELKSTLVNVDFEVPPISGAEFQNALNFDWSVASPEDVAKAFETISVYGTQQSLSISDSVFDGICDAVKSKCTDMQDEDLFRVLRALALWGPGAESLEAKNFDMWKDLDAVCTSRTKLWPRRTLLYVADHWFNLKLVRASQFMYQCNRKLARNPSTLSAPELVQAMFYVNAFRKNIHVGVMREYEFSLEQNIDKLNIDEIAIFAMAFFKSETKMCSDGLLSKIIDRTMESASTVKSISLAAILKTLRYSVRLTLGDKLWGLLDTLQKEVPRVTLTTCMHMVLLGTNTQVLHEGTVRAVCERVVKEFGSLRVKDIERLVMALTLFNYDPETSPCVYKVIVSELQNPERAEEFKFYKKCLPRALYSLALRNIYLPELTAHVLDPEFLRESYGKDRYMIGLEILGLDVGVELECPTYSGPRLEERTKRIVSKKYRTYMPDSMKRNTAIAERMLREVFDAAVLAAGRSSRVCAMHILPQFARPDVVFCVGPSGELQDLPEVFLEDISGSVVRPIGGTPDDRWCALICAANNMYVRDSDRPTGMMATHLRLLQVLGYQTIVVPWYEWIRLTEEGRAPYIKKIMESVAQ